MYWWAAQTLAKDGYVVLTFDPQGQGQSDTPGEGADANEGVPAQSDGRPFYDGTEDAIDYFLSTPGNPYRPVPSCSTGPATPPSRKTRRRRPRQRLQPLLGTARPRRDRPRRPLLRRRRRLLHRPVGSPRQRDRGLGQPRRPRSRSRLGAGLGRRQIAGRAGLPCAPREPHHRPDHQAGAGALRRLRAAGDAQHFAAGPRREVDRVPRLLRGRRRPSSAAAPTSTSASSPPRPSGPRCAAPISPPGTPAPGSTSTSRANRAPTAGC